MYSYDITSLEKITTQNVASSKYLGYNLSFKLRGEELRLCTYGKTIHSGYKRHERHKKVYATIEEEVEAKKKNKEASVRRAKERVLDSVMTLTQEQGRHNIRFLIFTTRMQLSRQELLHYFNLVIKKQNYYLSAIGQPPMPYIATIEVQGKRLKRTGIAVLHIHMVTAIKWLQPEQFKHFCKLWEETLPPYQEGEKSGNCNFSRKRPPQNGLHAARYVTKYMDKEIDMVEARKKRYLISKGLARPPEWRSTINMAPIEFMQKFAKLTDLFPKFLKQTETKYVGKKFTVFYTAPDNYKLTTLLDKKSQRVIRLTTKT